MATLGKAVNFGFTGTDGISATNLSGKIILQGVNVSPTAEEEQIKGPAGALAVRTFFNPGTKATLELVVSGTTIADSILNSTIGTTAPCPPPGTIISITACPSSPSLVKTNWVVVPEPSLVGSNTGAAKVTLPLEAHDGITAAAS